MQCSTESVGQLPMCQPIFYMLGDLWVKYQCFPPNGCWPGFQIRGTALDWKMHRPKDRFNALLLQLLRNQCEPNWTKRLVPPKLSALSQAEEKTYIFQTVDEIGPQLNSSFLWYKWKEPKIIQTMDKNWITGVLGTFLPVCYFKRKRALAKQQQ